MAINNDTTIITIFVITITTVINVFIIATTITIVSHWGRFCW